MARKRRDAGDVAHFTCLGCPIGCPLVLVHEGTEIVEVSGNRCNRGAKYARQEFTDPRRGLSTTVAIAGARWERLPVKVTAPVPKDRQLEAARIIHGLCAQAPVKLGDVLLQGLLGEADIAVVATRGMERLNGDAPRRTRRAARPRGGSATRKAAAGSRRAPAARG